MLFIYVYLGMYVMSSYLHIWDASTVFSEPIPKVLIRLNAEDGVAEVTFFQFQKFPGLNVMMLTSEMWWLQYDLYTYMCSYICICIYIHKMIWTQARFVAYGCESSWSHYNQPCLWSPFIFPPAHIRFCVYRDFVVGLWHQILENPKLTRMELLNCLNAHGRL